MEISEHYGRFTGFHQNYTPLAIGIQLPWIAELTPTPSTAPFDRMLATITPAPLGIYTLGMQRLTRA